MTNYSALAQELLHALDATGPRPPHEDISQTQRGEMAVLRLLATQRRQMLAGEISRSLSMTTSRIAAVLNSLEKKGLIERSADTADRRRVLVAMTKSGAALCAHRKACARRRLAAIFERLGQEDTDQFIRLIRRIAQISESLGACAPESGKQGKGGCL